MDIHTASAKYNITYNTVTWFLYRLIPSFLTIMHFIALWDNYGLLFYRDDFMGVTEGNLRKSIIYISRQYILITGL